MNQPGQDRDDAHITMGFANEEYPDIKGDKLLKLQPDLEVE